MSWSRLRAYFADALGTQQPPRAPHVTARIWVGTREVPIYETSRGYTAGMPSRTSRVHSSIQEAIAEARYGYVAQASRAATRSRSRSRKVSRLPLAKPERTFREQSFIFPMALYSQLDAARWCRAHNRRCDKVEAWGKHWRVRQIDPALCVPGTFKMVTYGKGIRAVFCHVRARAALRRAA